MYKTDETMRGDNIKYDDELLAGSYNPKERKKLVMNRLQSSCHEIRSLDLVKIVKNEAAVGRGRGRPRSREEDVCTMQLNSLQEQISRLRSDIIDKFKGPHFTREYRTLEGDCLKLQTELDQLAVSGRNDLREKRKNAVMEIESLAMQLASKAHPDGRSCDECEC